MKLTFPPVPAESFRTKDQIERQIADRVRALKVQYDAYIETLKKQVESVPAAACLKLADALRKSEFFTAAGSRNNHHSYRGGLFEHCWEVFEHLNSLSVLITGKAVSVEASFLLAFGHDIEKVGRYRLGSRNVKIDGQWTPVPDYKHVHDQIGFGHAVGSMMHVQRICGFDVPESILLAIRWHMGTFENSESNGYCDFGHACSIEPLVLLLHTADMLSATRNAPLVAELKAVSGID